MMKKHIIYLLLLLGATSTSAQELIKHERLLSFEEELPSYITSSNKAIEVSNLRYKDGKSALRWTFNEQATLNIHKDLHYEDTPSGSSHISTFSAWIYNVIPSDTPMTFEFYKDQEKCSWFQFNLNFTGWRAIHVAYKRDMQGKPKEGMNQIKIISPNQKGELFLDMIVTSSRADKRHHTQDFQQPFVNKGVTNHWQLMLETYQIQPDESLQVNRLTEADKETSKLLEARLRQVIEKETTVNQKKVTQLQKELAKYNIKRNERFIDGTPLFYVYNSEPLEKLIPNWTRTLYAKRGQEYKDYFNLMYKVANNYIHTSDSKLKEQLEAMFIDMYDYASDQGVIFGSGLGSASHYGYSFRGLFTSYFLMKEVLIKHNKLDMAYKTLQWYAQVNEVFIKPTANGQDMDAFNTLAQAKICSILIMEDSPLKFQYIKAYSRWVDTGCKPANGLNGAFKVDGGAFHHVNHYPAYAVGGLDGVTDMIYIFHATPFAISEEGHSTIKRVLLNMRFYCNQNYFPLAMSGRHPDGRGQLVPFQYAKMALSGTPDQKHEIDKEMGAAFLRLIQTTGNDETPEYVPTANTKQVNDVSKLLIHKGISAEAHPNGNLEMGYASISAHRRANWLALAKGFSRYFWASEHYARENFYGRYLSYGTLQILTSKNREVVTPKTSGWIEEGFNWARIPGTTAINLPIELMRAAKNSSEMLLSDESFSGGISQEGENGAFGIKLHEHDRYDGSHRARKSYHFFGNKIIALGSDIQNNNKEYTTETTLFQLAILNQEDKSFWEDNPNVNFWMDHIGTGYYIPNNYSSKLLFEKNYPQHSRLNTGEKSKGDWVSLTINHGKAPKNEKYEYMVMPQTSRKELQKAAKSYEVIKHDNIAHVVKDKSSKTTSFVFFEPIYQSVDVIKSVDTPCLVMAKEQGKTRIISVANPDLAFYTGESREIRDKDGKRRMVNPYAVPWRNNESKVMPVKLVVNGKWKPTKEDKNYSVEVVNAQTEITVYCQHGFSYDIELVKDK